MHYIIEQREYVVLAFLNEPTTLFALTACVL